MPFGQGVFFMSRKLTEESPVWPVTARLIAAFAGDDSQKKLDAVAIYKTVASAMKFDDHEIRLNILASYSVGKKLRRRRWLQRLCLKIDKTIWSFKEFCYGRIL